LLTPTTNVNLQVCSAFVNGVIISEKSSAGPRQSKHPLETEFFSAFVA
jgi:hypothetical protein